MLTQGVSLNVILKTMVMFIIVFSLDGQQLSNNQQQDRGDIEYLLNMSVDDLMNIEIEQENGLLEIDSSVIPSGVTTITQGQIWVSGANSLNELLETYVPQLCDINRTRNDKSGLADALNNKCEDKYLLMLNGIIMDGTSFDRASNNCDHITLSEISHIDIVRGPGSSIYGPRAVSMVVNIVTKDEITFQFYTIKIPAVDCEMKPTINLFSEDSMFQKIFGK